MDSDSLANTALNICKQFLFFASLYALIISFHIEGNQIESRTDTWIYAKHAEAV